MSKKWWNALVGKKTQTKKVDVLADIDAITEFLSEVQYDTKELLAQFKKLKRYEFFENDVNVNGLRVKMIAKEFLKRASKAGMTDLVRQKEKDKKWMMLW